jgi:hypothetical protein
MTAEGGRPYCAAGGNACDSFQIGLRERPCPEGECSVRPLDWEPPRFDPPPAAHPQDRDARCCFQCVEFGLPERCGHADCVCHRPSQPGQDVEAQARDAHFRFLVREFDWRDDDREAALLGLLRAVHAAALRAAQAEAERRAQEAEARLAEREKE